MFTARTMTRNAERQIPHYSDTIRRRISNALAKASASRRVARYLGYDPRTAGYGFSVGSNTRRTNYFVKAHQDARRGGYVYIATGPAVVWITCNCESFSEHRMPCAHAAKVAIRIDREARRRMSGMRLMPFVVAVGAGGQADRERERAMDALESEYAIDGVARCRACRYILDDAGVCATCDLPTPIYTNNIA